MSEPEQAKDNNVEIYNIRQRLHRMNDILQTHVGKLHEHDIKIDLLDRQTTALTTKAATREQLDTAVLLLGEKMTNAVTLMAQQIKTIADDIAPIKKGIYWTIGIVLSAVILAVLSQVLQRPIGR